MSKRKKLAKRKKLLRKKLIESQRTPSKIPDLAQMVAGELLKPVEQPLTVAMSVQISTGVLALSDIQNMFKNMFNNGRDATDGK